MNFKLQYDHHHGRAPKTPLVIRVLVTFLFIKKSCLKAVNKDE